MNPQIAYKLRQVLLGVVVKRRIRQALDILYDFLIQRGPNVWVIHLSSPDGSKVCVNDLYMGNPTLNAYWLVSR
jgi:hypothetical protein